MEALPPNRDAPDDQARRKPAMGQSIGGLRAVQHLIENYLTGIYVKGKPRLQ
jgi:hypothetical protein